MRWRLGFAIAACLLLVQPAEARRIALVIGQNAYPGGTSATVALPALANPALDASRMAVLLTKYGFDVISCDGRKPGCFNLSNANFLAALDQLRQRAIGADLALVHFAGHGFGTGEGNMLAPIEAKFDCATGVLQHGIAIEDLIVAAMPARHKLLIIDACRDNPLDGVCPNLEGKKLAFSRIEPGAAQSLLLVTSTQFGQYAMDGRPGEHSPFASALFSSLESNPTIYFEQVFNEVARATYDAAQNHRGFVQIPGKVVGGEAPADCLAGKGCIGDARMAALAVENERLTADAAGVRNLLAAEEKVRGKPYTAEERNARVAELEGALARIGISTDPLRQEARRLIDAGNVADGTAKLDEALTADEKALADIERAAAERRKAAARSALDLAVLARGTDVLKSVAYYKRATGLDPADAQTWIDYGEAANDAGKWNEALKAFERAADVAARGADPSLLVRATYEQGVINKDLGKHVDALRLAETARAMAIRWAEQEPDNRKAQRYLSVSSTIVGDVFDAQGDSFQSLKAYRDSLGTFEKLATADPGDVKSQRDLFAIYWRVGNIERRQGSLATALETARSGEAVMVRLTTQKPNDTVWQRDLAAVHWLVGDILSAQYNQTEALKSFRDSLAIFDRLTKADPGNLSWQHDLSVTHAKIGVILQAEGNLPEALKSFLASHVISDRLAKAEPGKANWQSALVLSHQHVGDVLRKQGSLPEALVAFRDSLAVAERLTKANPGNFSWQYDLLLSHEMIGHVLRDEGNLPEALKAFREGLTIAERLANAKPDNAEWQRALATSYENIATVLKQQGNSAPALTAFKQGREILAKLYAPSPHDMLRVDLDWFDGEISKLENPGVIPRERR